jgi:hypothetical protein
MSEAAYLKMDRILPTAGFGPVDTTAADALIAIACITISIDGEIAAEERDAFRAIVSGVRRLQGESSLGAGESSDADIDALLERHAGAVSLSKVELAQKVAELAGLLDRNDLRELAYKIAFALSLSDFETAERELELDAVLVSSFGFDRPRVDALTSEVYASLEPSKEVSA